MRKSGGRERYPSDISEEQFAKVLAILSGGRSKTRPREVDLHEVFCAVLYVLRSGCQWRMLPKGFPKWRTVYYYWRLWSRTDAAGSLLEQALKKIGWRGPREPWAQQHPELARYRCPEREKHRSCRT
jgi:transposase